MGCPYVMKKCNKCNNIFHINKFYKNKNCKYGVGNDCKECCKKKSNDYYKNNKEERLEYANEYRKNNKDKIKQYKQDTKEKYEEYNKKYQKQYHKEHKEEKKIYDKKYRIENKDRIVEYQKQYYEEHKEEIRVYHKNWYNENKDKKEYKEKRRKYREENPHVQFNGSNNRRQKEQEQGRGITREQWYEMMNFFEWKCAYSGEYIGGKENSKVRTIDHVIPLNKDGINEPWNCVPMYRSYNISKHDNDMLEWYKQQEYFSEERLDKIYEWQKYAYDKWNKQVDKI